MSHLPSFEDEPTEPTLEEPTEPTFPIRILPLPRPAARRGRSRPGGMLVTAVAGEITVATTVLDRLPNAARLAEGSEVRRAALVPPDRRSREEIPAALVLPLPPPADPAARPEPRGRAWRIANGVLDSRLRWTALWLVIGVVVALFVARSADDPAGPRSAPAGSSAR